MSKDVFEERARIWLEDYEAHKRGDRSFLTGDPICSLGAVLRIAAMTPWQDKDAAFKAEAIAVIQLLLQSAHPHPVEHPTMTAAWRVAEAFLASHKVSV